MKSADLEHPRIDVEAIRRQHDKSFGWKIAMESIV
jgi:hypothetical protein